MRCSPTRSRSAPRSPKSPSTTVRSRSPGSRKAAQRRRRGGSDAPAGRCRRRRGRPHLPLRRQAHTGPRTDRARNGRRLAARVMSPRTHPLSADLAATGGKGPRTWSRWSTDRGRSPAQPLVRLKGARTPAHWAPLPDGTYPTRINGGPAADHRRAHRRGVLPDGEPGRIGQAVPENLLPSRRPRIAPRRVKCPISRHPSPPDQAQVLGAARISDVTITVDQGQQARWVDVTGRCS